MRKNNIDILCILTGLLLPLTVFAEDEGGEQELNEAVPTEEVQKTFEELGLAPKFRVTAFKDREDGLDCDFRES